jgi:BirA family biotin operon repressor/biotin-[acetyl-CoA-carboxylase] ligase
MYKNLANTLFVGKNLIFMTSCHSTNQEAYDRIAQGSVPDGTMLITNHQTAGRGQMGNTWEARAGMNLTFSLIMQPRFLEVSRQFLLNMAVSLGITDWLHTWSDDFRIKWPNDIFFHEYKMGGILIQNLLRGTSLSHSIIGIGLNINQHQFDSPRAISLTKITGETFALPPLLESLGLHLEQRYLQLRGGGGGLQEEYLSRLFRYGKEELYQEEKQKQKQKQNERYFRGRIVDVEPSGALIMQTASGRRSFQFKEVSFII